jgi:hypothetical protein
MKYKEGDTVKLTAIASDFYASRGEPVDQNTEFNVVWCRYNEKDESASLYGIQSGDIQLKVFQNELQ